MRIPSAYIAGFGQKVTPAAPAVMPDAAGPQSIAAAGMNLAGSFSDIAAEQRRIEEQAAREAAAEQRQAEREAKAEQKQAEREALREMQRADQDRLKTETNTALNQHENLLAKAAMFIDSEQQGTPGEIMDNFRSTASQIRTQLLDNVPPEFVNHVIPVFEKQQNSIEMGLTKNITAQLRDQSRANQFVTVEELKNNPVKSVEEKIQLYQDPNFWVGSNLSQQEIEAHKLNAIAGVTALEVEKQFTAARNDLKALETLKGQLTAGTESGYSWLPAMPEKQRQDAIQSVATKIDVTRNMIRTEQQRRQAEARQLGSELLMEFKDKVNAGWVPQSAADYQFVAQVRNHAATSPSLARQYEDTARNMTDFAFREKLRTKDPLGTTAAEQGVILPPLNLNDPKSITGRVAVARQLGSRAVLRGPELDALTDHLQTMDPRTLTTYVKTLNNALGPFGPTTLSAAAEQSRVKNPGMATLFQLLAVGKPVAAQWYAEGRAVTSAEGKDFLKEQTTSLKKELATEIGKSLGTAFQVSPASRNSIDDAIAVAYIGAARQRNISLDKLDDGLYQTVVREVVGDTVQTGRQGGLFQRAQSVKTTVVPPGMTADQFTNNIKAITPDEVAKRGGINGMSDSDAAKFLKTHAWHEYGKGYRFYNEDRTDVYGKNGKVFEWNFNDVLPSVAPAPTRINPPQPPPRRVEPSAAPPPAVITPPAAPVPVHPKIEKYTAQLAELEPKAATLHTELNGLEQSMEAARGHTIKFPLAQQAYKDKKKELAETQRTIQQLHNGIQGYRDYPNRD